MAEGKWMVHVELACGSLEYVGAEPPAEALAAVLDALLERGMVRGAEGAGGKEER